MTDRLNLFFVCTVPPLLAPHVPSCLNARRGGTEVRMCKLEKEKHTDGNLSFMGSRVFFVSGEVTLSLEGFSLFPDVLEELTLT